MSQDERRRQSQYIPPTAFPWDPRLELLVFVTCGIKGIQVQQIDSRWFMSSHDDIDQFPPSGRLRRMQRKLKKLPCRCSLWIIQPTKPNAVLIKWYQLKYDTWVVLICKIVVSFFFLSPLFLKWEEACCVPGSGNPGDPGDPGNRWEQQCCCWEDPWLKTKKAKGEVRRTPNNWQHTVSGEMWGNPKKEMKLKPKDCSDQHV